MLDSRLGQTGQRRRPRPRPRRRRALVRAGVTPNGLSYAALVLGLVRRWLFYVGRGGGRWRCCWCRGCAMRSTGASRGSAPARRRGAACSTSPSTASSRPRCCSASPCRDPAWHRRRWCWPAPGTSTCASSSPSAPPASRRSEKLIVYPPGLLERSESLLFAFARRRRARLAPRRRLPLRGPRADTAAQRFRYGRRALR